MDTVSVTYGCVTNNHTIAVVFKNKHLFLIQASVGWLGKFFNSLQVFLLTLLLMFRFGARTGGTVSTGYVCLMVMAEVQKSHANRADTLQAFACICLLISHWAKQVLWPNPKSRIRQAHFTFPEAKAKVWIYNSLYRGVNNQDQ